MDADGKLLLGLAFDVLEPGLRSFWGPDSALWPGSFHVEHQPCQCHLQLLCSFPALICVGGPVGTILAAPAELPVDSRLSVPEGLPPASSK